MSNIVREKEPEIQYIFNNDAEFILDSDLNCEEMNDIIYTDGTEAIVVNGHLLEDSENPTALVLQEGEDISQYFINNDKGELLIADIQNGALNGVQETQQIIQYVDEDGNIMDPQEIVYINEDTICLEQNFGQYQLTELMDSDNTLSENEKDAPAVDLQSLPVQGNDDSDWYQYAVLKNDGLPQYTVPVSDFLQTTVDNVAGIRGKNLLTGQVVTLDSYMEKIEKKVKSFSKNPVNWKRPKHNLNAFLNKKFNLGLTVGGRQLVGKIVHVDSKEVQAKSENGEGENGNISINETEDLASENNNSEYNQQQIQKKLFSKKSGQFQRISKTLSSLMNMESVSKQLYQKSIKIKLIDKYCDDTKKISRNVSFISGYMQLQVVTSGENCQKCVWSFVPDTLKTHNLQPKAERKSKIRYPDTVGLTILTTHQNNKQLVQIILEDAKNQCDYCEKVFKSEQNLACHLNEVHHQCELCKHVFKSLAELTQHNKVHVHLGELHRCSLSCCKKCFKTESLLQKHMLTHKLEAFKCSICPYSGMSEVDLKEHYGSHPYTCDICNGSFVNATKLARHKKTHPIIEKTVKQFPTSKYYACDICKRTFSKQSNLQRHVDVHKGAEQLYRCAICECSYHYISSLTRHIVQNHVQIKRPNFVPNGEETMAVMG